MEVINSLKKHRKTNPFVQIDKAIINDSRLSWKAKGLLMYLLAQSDSWQFYENEICNHGTDGRTSVSSGLKELEENGYLIRTWIRNEKGQYTGRLWEIFEEPLSKQSDSDRNNINNDEVGEDVTGCRKPETGSKTIKTPGCRKPETGYSEDGKPATNNINNNNKEEEEEGLFLQNNYSYISDFDQDILFFEQYTAIEMNSSGRKEIYNKWRNVWGFSHEMIMKAAELMCQLARTPNLSYIDQILYKWKLQNIFTIEEADTSVQKFRTKKRKRSESKQKYKQSPYISKFDTEYEIYVPPNM